MWVAALIAAVSWPMLASFFPVGISSYAACTSAGLYDLAFVGALVGAVSALVAIGRLRSVLLRVPTLLRWRLECTTLVGVATAASALVLIAHVSAARGASLLVHWDVMIPALFATTLHLAAIGVALLRVAPLPASGRPFVLAALACALPAVAPQAFAPVALVRAGEDFRHAPTSGGWTASALEIEPILAWLAAALLLEVARSRRP